MWSFREERASQVALVVKNSPASAGDMRRGFNPWVRKIPWRKAWLPTPVFLPGESHGQSSLAGHSPWHRRVRQCWSDLALAAERRWTGRTCQAVVLKLGWTLHQFFNSGDLRWGLKSCTLNKRPGWWYWSGDHAYLCGEKPPFQDE